MAKKMMKVRVRAGEYDPGKTRMELLAVGVFSDGKDGKYLRRVDRLLGGAVGRVRKLGDFKAKEGTTAVLYGDRAKGPQRVLLVGLGERKKMQAETFRQAATKAVCTAVELNVAKCVLGLDADAPAAKLDAEHLGEALCGGACFGAYRYDEYVGDEEKTKVKTLDVLIADVAGKRGPKFAKGMKTGNTVGHAQNFARTIMNRPANVISPGALAVIARKLAGDTAGLSCTVLDDKQIRAKGMGGLMAVGQGSSNRPRLIVLKYSGGAKGGKNHKTIALVGKAITFDSGGISIKPSAGMQDMKFDKSGGVAVLGAMKAIAELKCAVDVYGIIPSAENMPGGMSYRPGDIVETYSGKTVEIQNTDAEGRMILCDAIAYARELKCDAIVDIATLTGACAVALGEGMAGVMGHSDKLVERVKKASDRSGEKVWHLPCDEEFLEQMKSKIADLKNIGGKWGGACTAAAFLGEFARGVEWAHIDMAGTGMVDGEKKYGTPGSIGFGVRLLTALAAGFGS